jgi:hypothetical protein
MNFVQERCCVVVVYGKEKLLYLVYLRSWHTIGSVTFGA